MAAKKLVTLSILGTLALSTNAVAEMSADQLNAFYARQTSFGDGAIATLRVREAQRDDMLARRAENAYEQRTQERHERDMRGPTNLSDYQKDIRRRELSMERGDLQDRLERVGSYGAGNLGKAWAIEQALRDNAAQRAMLDQ